MKVQVSKVTEVSIPGHRKREVKREKKELEISPECQLQEAHLREMVSKQLSV